MDHASYNMFMEFIIFNNVPSNPSVYINSIGNPISSTIVGIPHIFWDNIKCNVCFLSASAFLSHSNNFMRDLLNAIVYIKFRVNVDYLQNNTCTCLVSSDVSFK